MKGGGRREEIRNGRKRGQEDRLEEGKKHWGDNERQKVPESPKKGEKNGGGGKSCSSGSYTK